MCIAWICSTCLNEDDTNFATFVNMDMFVSKVFAQKNFWECDHQVVFNFKTYI